jgi:type IV pilus assembly protein PilB
MQVKAFLSGTDLPECELREGLFEPDVLSRVPVDVCRRHNAIPVSNAGTGLVVAVADPSAERLRALGSEIGCAIEPVLAAESAIKRVLDEQYGEPEP